MMRTFQNDMNYGMEKEMTMLGKLSQHFIEYGTITNTKDLYKDPYYKYDFEAEDGTTFELKSRRNKKQTYPTTILPVSKIIPDAKHKQVFIFAFTDCCCKIEYSKELWDTFEVRDIEVFRYGRIDLPKPHYCIPIQHLLEIN
jgi:hypothetical protein